MDTMISLSVCVPALNEEANLRDAVADLLKTLSGAVARLEVVIVDDGSSDDTGRIADDLARRHAQVRVIHHERPSGIGACYRDAVRAATCDYCCWFPADGENSASEFVHCLPHVAEDVIVTCYHGRADRRRLLRKALSHCYTAVMNAAFGLRMRYYNGLAVIPRSVLAAQPAVSRGFFFNAENIIRAVKRRRCTVVELHYPLEARAGGRSKAVSLRSFCCLAHDMFNFLKEKS